MNNRLKEVRTSLGLSQSEFADKLFLSHDLISAMERGKRKITERTVEAICKEFDVNKEWLVNGYGEIFKDCLQELNIDKEIKDVAKTLFELDKDDRNAIIHMINTIKNKHGI